MIDILMATFNGEKYIEEQINSILKQTYSDWHLYIQDDASTDKTCEIIEKIVSANPEKITFIKKTVGSGSAKENFLSMLKYVKSDYFMFSDQDDFWLNNKIENTHSAMIAAEYKYGKNCPIAVHTDLYVTDEKLNIKTNSWLKKSMFFKRNKTLLNSMLDSPLAGCTTELNKAVLSVVLTDNLDEIYVHDWWISLCVLNFGHIVTLYNPTILYRQHSNNSVGVRNEPVAVSALKTVFLSKQHKHRKDIVKSKINTLKNFYYIYYESIDADTKIAMKKLFESESKIKLKKIYTVIKYHIGAPSLVSLLYYFAFC